MKSVEKIFLIRRGIVMITLVDCDDHCGYVIQIGVFDS